VGSLLIKNAANYAAGQLSVGVQEGVVRDLRTSLFISAAAPMVALGLTMLLPATGERRRLEPEVAVT